MDLLNSYILLTPSIKNIIPPKIMQINLHHQISQNLMDIPSNITYHPPLTLHLLLLYYLLMYSTQKLLPSISLLSIYSHSIHLLILPTHLNITIIIQPTYLIP